MKFEEALKKLEKIVEDLETGDVELEKSIQKFEEGMKLVSFCNNKLQEIEKKIEIVVKDKKGTLKKKPFPKQKAEDTFDTDEISDSASDDEVKDEELLF